MNEQSQKSINFKPILISFGITLLVYLLTIFASAYVTYKSLGIANESRIQDVNICQSEIISSVCTQEYLSQIANDHYLRQQEQFQYLKEIIDDVKKVIEPTLQLLLIVSILMFVIKNAWALFPNKMGDLKLEQNSIRSLIALIVVVTFAVAIFLGNDISSALKDVVLVVIAFYFGSTQIGKQVSKDESTDTNSMNSSK